MIRKAYVLRDYARKNPLEQVQFANFVIPALMANPGVFIPAELPVPVLNLTNATSDLSSKYNDFKTKGNGYKEAFIAAQLVWVELFNVTADYVDMKAHAAGVVDAGAIIQLAAFSVTKTESDPAQLPDAPVAEMEISNSERGMITASAKPVAGARGYLFSVASPEVIFDITGNQVTVKMGNTFASFIIGTKRDVKFVNLPATEVSAAAAAFNSAGLGTFSDPIDVKIP